MFGLIVGSTVGGYLPVVFGQDMLSASALIGTFVGGALGIWLAYRFS
jgi:hypothetical protein